MSDTEPKGAYTSCCDYLLKKCRDCGFQFGQSEDTLCPRCHLPRFCGIPSEPGKSRCKRHLQAKGIHHHRANGHPQSEYMKKIPSHLFDDFLAAYADPHLLSCRKEIAILDARISQLFKRLKERESGKCWRTVKSCWDAVSKANAAGDPAKLSQALGNLGRAIIEGSTEEDTWKDIKAAINQRTTLANREVTYLREMREGMTLEQVAILLARLADAVESEVQDPETKKRIAARLSDVYPPRGFINILKTRPAQARIIDATAKE